MSQQERPEPMPQSWDTLAQVLARISYDRDAPLSGRRFQLVRRDEENYAVLYVFTYNINTYRRGEMRHTRHERVVPVATYNEAAWTRWVFDQLVAIETHETAEWFFVDGRRVYAPHHGDGEDPYVLWYDGHPDRQALAPGEV